MNNPGINIGGFIMSAPALAMYPPKPEVLKLFGLYVAPIAQDFVFTSGISPSVVSVRPRVNYRFFTDRYMVGGVGAKQINMLFWFMYSYKYNAKYLTHPILMLQGKWDGVVDNEALVSMYNNFAGEKTRKVYDYAKHELHEDAKMDVLNDVEQWINEWLKKPCCKPLGKFRAKDYEVKFLPIAEKFQHKGKLAAVAVFMYFIIGYLLMKWGIIFRNRHGQ